MTKFYVYIFFLLILFSCKDSQRDSALFILKEWEKREIKFLSNSVFTKFACDTVEMDVQSDFKLLSYIDSVGCASCKFQMPLWRDFIFETESIENRKVVFLFYICPKNRKEIEHILKRDRFDYPICIDEADSLNILNDFPSDSRFQTFLLDKSNKVLAIGNPVFNPEIKELFLSIISGKMSLHPSSEQLPLTNISLSKDKLDMGSFPWSEKKEADIVVSNMGKIPLVLNSVVTSCGCLSVEYSKEPIRLGKKMTMKVKYKAEHPEHFNKTITVYCNAENAPLKLSISGNAK